MKRDSRLFDAEGREVLVTMVCPRCHRVQPFGAFGIRRMPDGKQRSIPWCRTCRGASGAPRGRPRRAGPATVEAARRRLQSRGIVVATAREALP